MTRSTTAIDPRVARSRAVILPAATRHFLAEGYVAANLDRIAAEANVSKRTIYNLFGDKEHLFREVLSEVFATAESYAARTVRSMGSTDALETTLETAAVELARIVTSDPIVRVRRLMIAEAERFPELAAEYWTSAPGRTIAAIASQLEHLHQLDLLALDDPHRAAEQFAYLVIGSSLDLAMFNVDNPPPPEQVDTAARAGVRVFLAAYRSRTTPRATTARSRPAPRSPRRGSR